MKKKRQNVPVEPLFIQPEGWYNSLRIDGLSRCGVADPGISISVVPHGQSDAPGGVLTRKDILKLLVHLQELLPFTVDRT